MQQIILNLKMLAIPSLWYQHRLQHRYLSLASSAFLNLFVHRQQVHQKVKSTRFHSQLRIREELRDITRLILENPRMILFGKTLMKCVCYSFRNCFFVEEVDFSLCRMHVDIHRPWINMHTRQTLAISMR
jgi:hypothetical protein